jgi:uncharacterized membrane protein YphA (DoxX/SURF4 family)
MIPDVNGLERLNPDRLKARWRDEVTRIGDHYGFTNEQRSKAQVELADSEQYAGVWFSDREMSEKRNQYLHDLAGVQKVERDRGAMSYERERAAEKRKELDKDRRDLLKDLDARGLALREAVTKLATPEQIAAAGPYAPPRTQLDMINMTTAYSLWLMGLCLMLGFLTRFAALGGALFLAQIYFSMPPWPGLPQAPVAEGHYLIVNKNLIEMTACLALACLPTGQWVGLDALVFGRFRRGRAEPETEAVDPGYPGRFGPRSLSRA